jgi:predicted nucleic acid-binding protein
VTPGGSRGPVVIDTDVFSADLIPGSRLGELYRPVTIGRPAFVSFQTVAEVRYGAVRRGWGEARMRRLEAKMLDATVVQTGPQLILVCAQLRVACADAGHALAQREHTGDRWIAATALRLGLPLVSNDGIFQNVPGLILESAAMD